MITSIFKYALVVTSAGRLETTIGRHAVIKLKMPSSAVILHVDRQENNAYLWATVNPEETNTDEVEILVLGTGEKIEQNEFLKWRHLGTVQLYEGNLVLHFFIRHGSRMRQQMERFA